MIFNFNIINKMDVGNQIQFNSNGNSGKNGLIWCKIPIFEIPPNEDILISFMFNEEINTIESHLLNQNSSALKKYQINSYPVEKCKICKCELYVDNFFFLDKIDNFELYCNNCCHDKEPNNGLNKNYFVNQQINEKLNLYLKKNKYSSTSQYIKAMEDLIIFTYKAASLEGFFRESKVFQKYYLYLNKYITTLTSYLKIVDEFKMENLFLFLKNFIVISSCKNDNSVFISFFNHYYDNIKNFNISSFQLSILNNIVGKNMKLASVFLGNAEFQIKKNKIKLKREISDDFSSLKIKLANKKISWLRKEIKIKEIKNNIINFLRNYNYSYNYISSKKVLERKFINSILFTLFKYHHEKFDKVKESDNLINALQKELQNILRFLGDSKEDIVTGLKQKITYEYKLLESKKKSNKPGNKKSNITEKITKKKLSLTIKEKDLLQNYLLSASEDSYTTITASKSNSPGIINYKKLQVITEFLFFIRDKTVNIIHLLNKNVLIFFEFLNQCCPNKKEEKQKEEQIEINEIKNEGDEYSSDDDVDDEDVDIDNDDYIEELKNDFNTSFSKAYEKKNKDIFKSQKIKTKNEINLTSALKYIFYSSSDNDFSNEINYLYENVVLPKRNKGIELPKIEKEKNEENYRKIFQERIEKIFNELDNKFKNDPLYNQIMEYLNEFIQSKKKDKLNSAPQNIQFYEENVDNFLCFKQVFIMLKEVKEYLKIMDLENNCLKKLKLIKEKYKYVLEGLEKYLIPNHENYQKYYEEWKAKYTNLVVKDYELKDLLEDLEKLIPSQEVIEISGRDKRNFNLILYLFQNDYFLKDYI